MITVQIQTVRSAEVTISPAGPFVTLRCGGYDRVVIHTKNDTDARALAAIFNGALQTEVGK